MLLVDLRERTLASDDNLEGTRQEIAERYGVSLGMVKKLPDISPLDFLWLRYSRPETIKNPANAS